MLRNILLITTVAAAAGCTTPSVQTQKTSFEAGRSRTIALEDPLSFLQLRTVLVLGDLEGFAAVTTHTEGDRRTFELQVTSDTGANLGLAAAVRPDGILLTADHVVTGGDTKIVRFGNEASIETARVIARFPEHDLAVLLAERTNPHWFDILPDPNAAEQPLFSGCQGVNHPASGTLLEVAHAPGPPAFVHLTTTLPTRRGDSGGPIVDAEGRLLGIITGGRLGFFLEPRDPRGYGVMIDPEWLSRIDPATTPLSTLPKTKANRPRSLSGG